MLKSFLAHFLERTVRIEPQDSLSFVGQYSALSGIVTEISVGSLDQRLLVSLNFDAHFVSLYDPLNCPAFVGACYSSTDSPSYADGRDSITLENGRSLGRVPIGQTPVTGSVCRFREVAGWIGMSPRASLFDLKALKFQEVSDQVLEITEVSPDSPQAQTEARVPIFRSMGGWVVHCMTRLQGQLMPGIGLLLYEPGEQDLVLPDVLRDDVLQLLGDSGNMIYKKRLVIACSSVVDLELMFPNEEIHLRLDSLNLFIPHSHPPNRRDYCLTRIRFDASISTKAIIGRILTRTAGGVVLNFKRRWIEFAESPLVSEPYPSVPARIPVFALPRAPQHSHRLTLTPIVSPEDYYKGLILFNSGARAIGFAGVSGTGYSFIRVQPSRLQEIFRVRIDGFSSVEPPVFHPDGSCEFKFGHGDPRLELILAYGPAHVAIVGVARTTSSATQEIILPKPEVQSSEDLRMECPVCLDGIDDGQVKQRIEPCMHYFHQSCLSRWIEKNPTPNCPTCRSEIPRVNV